MTTNIRNASNFWIHAGDMSGEVRNQVELTDDLAQFFDDDARLEEETQVRLPNGTIRVRPLAYRGDDYGQWTEDIWRLGLPTARMGGLPYPGRVIKLERQQQDGGNFVYFLSVADVGSAQAAQWMQSAQTQGVVGQTGDTGKHPGRPYGYW